MTNPGPLAGIFVLDLTRVLAGPYCTMVLADLGARVVKVEAPGRGDDARAVGPFVAERSAYFSSLNRGKQSIALDLKDDSDREIFERLLARADVLVENFRPGVLARLGYGWESLHARWPGLIVASTSGFGQNGPYAQRPAYDVVVQAMGGVMSLTGHPGGEPTRVGTSMGDITAGLFTAIGVQAALVDRHRTGVGVHVDVSMLDSQVAILENAIARFGASGQVPGPIGARHPSITPFDAFATADEHLVIACGNDALFEKLCECVGRSDLVGDSRYSTNDSRTAHADALKVELESSLANSPRAEWLDRFGAAGIPCGPLNDVAEVIADPQVVARNMIVWTDDGAGGRIRMAGNPIKFSSYPDPSTRPAAPDLDADRSAILAELDDAER